MDIAVKKNNIVLSIVIPMYNETENAPVLLNEIRDALEEKLEYEVVVVNDGSSDSTQQVLQNLQTKMPRLKIVRHLKNAGQSTAIASGVRYADAPWIATLDGDGQNDPADIPALFAQTNGCNPSEDVILIAGNRRKRNDNWLRRLSSRIANSIRRSLLHDGCPDTGCGLKIFPRDAFLRLPHFNHMHRFLPVLFQRAHGRLINVPVNHRPRVFGQSKYGVWNRLWVGIVDIFGVLWLEHRETFVEVDVLDSGLSVSRAVTTSSVSKVKGSASNVARASASKVVKAPVGKVAKASVSKKEPA